MELRWFVTKNDNDVITHRILQYSNVDGIWNDVPFIVEHDRGQLFAEPFEDIT